MQTVKDKETLKVEGRKDLKGLRFQLTVGTAR